MEVIQLNLIRKILCLLILVCLFAGGVAEQNADGSVPARTLVISEQFNSSYASESFQNMLKQHPDIQKLIENTERSYSEKIAKNGFSTEFIMFTEKHLILQQER